MKRLFFILLFIASLTSFSQDFGALGTTWYYNEHAGGGCSGNCEYVKYESISDTVIQGKTTHKIVQDYFQINGDTTQLSSIYTYTNGDTAFYYSFDEMKFLRLFLFNQQVGDTLTLDYPPSYMGFPLVDSTTYRLLIDSIKIGNYDGVQLKEYYVTSLDDYNFYGGFFVDRIGGYDWLFPRGPIFPEAGAPIRCYRDAQIDTSFQTIACDYVMTSIEDIGDEDEIEIFPIPSNAYFNIKSSKPVRNFKIYNSKGQLIKISNDKNTINVSGWKRGIYYLKLMMENGNIYHEKIVIN